MLKLFINLVKNKENYTFYCEKCNLKCGIFHTSCTQKLLKTNNFHLINNNSNFIYSYVICIMNFYSLLSCYYLFVLGHLVKINY